MQQATATATQFLMRAWGAYERGTGAIVAACSKGNRAVGHWASRRPWLLILAAAVFAAGACLGWFRFRLEDNGDVLWVPQKGKSQDDKAYVHSHFPHNQAGASFYASLNPSQYAAFGGNDALQIPVTWEMFQLHNAIMNISVTDDNTGDSVSFSDLCAKTLAGTCSRGGYLDFWNYDFNTFIANVSGSPTDPTVGNQAMFRSQVSQLTYPDGNAVSLLSVFGGTSFNFTPSFRLASAQVIAVDYSLDSGVDTSTATNWQDAFRDLMFDRQPHLQYASVVFITGASLNEELGNAVSNDMLLIIISFIVFIVLAVLFLSKLDSVRTRTTLALLGVFCVAFGMMAGWGWGLLFGMPFTVLQELSPFILLGMGIDMLFILTKAYDIIIQREPGSTLGDAFGQLMATAGLSTQVTVMASAVAFALGAVSTLPSVQWFAAFAALNTVMMVLLMCTLFIGFFVLTERRIAAHRRDCCCCCCSSCTKPLPNGARPHVNAFDAASTAVPEVAFSPPVPQTVTVGIPMTVPVGVLAAPGVPAAPPPSGPVSPMVEESWLKKVFRLYYGPALARWWVKAPVLAIFTGYAIYSFWAIYHIKYGQPLSDLVPDGSYIKGYDTMYQSSYATQVGSPIGLYFRDLDFSSPTVQGKMLSALDQLLGDEYINASTSAFQGNWYIDFNHWAANRTTMVQAPGCTNPYHNRATGSLAGVIDPSAIAQQISGCVPAASFYPLLSQWLALPQNAGEGDIVRDATTGTIVTAAFSVMQVAPGDNDKFSMQFYKSVRDLESSLNDNLFAPEQSAAGTYVVFTYSDDYTGYEGDYILPSMALEYFMLALAGVGMVVLFMLVNPWTMVLIMAAVGLVDLFLFGELFMVGIRFNQVSIINMIMATGLAVDYVVYFAQKFMVVAGDGTRNGRMQIALADTGSAVFLGGFTALVGAVPMAFAKSVIIRTFFRLIFGTIVFSLAVGLLLMPVVLSLVGPPPVSSVMVVAVPVNGNVTASDETGGSGSGMKLWQGHEWHEATQQQQQQQQQKQQQQQQQQAARSSPYMVEVV